MLHSQLTAKADEQPQQITQLDELFDSDVLRLNIPFHDFSFLGDVVNDVDDPLNGRMPSGSLDPPDQQFAIPVSKSTPISPHDPRKDRVSGLDSLIPKSGLGEAESRIPPGLFIGVGEIKSGFLGKCLCLLLLQAS